MAIGNESQAGIPPHGIEGVFTCHENPPRGFLSLGFMSLAAKLGLRVDAVDRRRDSFPGVACFARKNRGDRGFTLGTHGMDKAVAI